jgi:hypothetical protein
MSCRDVRLGLRSLFADRQSPAVVGAQCLLVVSGRVGAALFYGEVYFEGLKVFCAELRSGGGRRIRTFK